MASLLTLVFTDVVESTATKRDVSLGRDSRERDHAYLEKVQVPHFDLIRGCCRAHGGREISTMGDAFFITFEDPLEAVRCAAEIQKRLTSQPIETPRGPLRLRIGVHAGYPELFEHTYHGTDVDKAARVEAMATAQQIVLSSTAYELVQHMTDVKFHHLGDFSLKGVDRVVLWEADWDGKGPRPTTVPPLAVERRKKRSRLRGWAILLAAVAVVAAYFYIHQWHNYALTDKDTVVLAEFANATGDPVFDSTLGQGLSAQLEQSPFLNLLSDTRIRQTLALMAQRKDVHITPDLARELCQRTGSAATIEGSIASMGSQYVVGLKAVSCRTGDALAEDQVTANGKEQVLKALGDAAMKLRQKLGESLASIAKNDAPPENVTTPSLEALQAYSLGYQAQIMKDDWSSAIPFFQRATSLDPNFAMAWARLGTVYNNLGETTRAAESLHKAFELRGRVSEREKFYIASHYELDVTGDLGAARKIYEMWAQTYPRDYTPLDNLCYVYTKLGEYNKALATIQESFRLNPESANGYTNLIGTYMHLNRLDDVRAAAQKARAHNAVSPLCHLILYLVDFLQHDLTGMDLEASELTAKPTFEHLMLYSESETAAYVGHFVRARALARRAIDLARRAHETEEAAVYEAKAGLREVQVRNTIQTRQHVQVALALSNGREVETISAVALGLAGDSAPAMRLARDLAKRFPDDTIVQLKL